MILQFTFILYNLKQRWLYCVTEITHWEISFNITTFLLLIFKTLKLYITYIFKVYITYLNISSKS